MLTPVERPRQRFGRREQDGKNNINERGGRIDPGYGRVDRFCISPDQGLMDTDLAQAELCRQLIGTPGEIIILVPPERVGRVGGVLVGPASEVDLIITGRDAPM